MGVLAHFREGEGVGDNARHAVDVGDVDGLVFRKVSGSFVVEVAVGLLAWSHIVGDEDVLSAVGDLVWLFVLVGRLKLRQSIAHGEGSGGEEGREDGRGEGGGKGAEGDTV